MDTFELITNRRSIRRYSSQPIREEVVQKILQAGMSGPSCVNARDYAFIVTQDKAKMLEMYTACGGPAAPLKDATLAILVCGDLNRSFSMAKEYWIIDAAIAAQNMSLAAYDLGLGNVWLGVWPQDERVRNLINLFELPDNIIPHSILAMGYPEDDRDMVPLTEERKREKFEADRIHREKW